METLGGAWIPDKHNINEFEHCLILLHIKKNIVALKYCGNCCLEIFTNYDIFEQFGHPTVGAWLAGRELTASCGLTAVHFFKNVTSWKGD